MKLELYLNYKVKIRLNFDPGIHSILPKTLPTISLYFSTNIWRFLLELNLFSIFTYTRRSAFKFIAKTQRVFPIIVADYCTDTFILTDSCENGLCCIEKIFPVSPSELCDGWSFLMSSWFDLLLMQPLTVSSWGRWSWCISFTVGSHYLCFQIKKNKHWRTRAQTHCWDTQQIQIHDAEDAASALNAEDWCYAS